MPVHYLRSEGLGGGLLECGAVLQTWLGSVLRRGRFRFLQRRGEYTWWLVHWGLPPAQSNGYFVKFDFSPLTHLIPTIYMLLYSKNIISLLFTVRCSVWTGNLLTQKTQKNQERRTEPLRSAVLLDIFSCGPIMICEFRFTSPREWVILIFILTLNFHNLSPGLADRRWRLILSIGLKENKATSEKFSPISISLCSLTDLWLIVFVLTDSDDSLSQLESILLRFRLDTDCACVHSLCNGGFCVDFEIR